jgi:hypothetical protein
MSLHNSDYSPKVSYTIAMVGEYVTSCFLYSAHKLRQITWHSGLLAQLEEHIIVGICCLSHKVPLGVMDHQLSGRAERNDLRQAY